MLALITAVACVCGNSVALDPERDEAVALARALLIHDESIHSIEWSAEAWTKRPGGGDGEWEMIQSAEHGLDESGRWYLHARVGMRYAAADPLQFHREDRWSADGVTQTRAHEWGAVTQWMDVTPLWYPNVALFMGRMCSVEQQQRLGEVLLAGENLRVIAPENADGIVRIGATAFVDRMARDFVVDVDTRHGFMPLRIETYERMRAAPLEVMQVTAIEEVKGVYLPAAGERTTFSTKEASDQQMADLLKALRQAGFDLDRRPIIAGPEDVEKYRAVVLDVFGPGGFPTELISEQRLAAVKIRSVNQVIDAGKFVPVVPEGMKIIDSRWNEPLVIIQGEDGKLDLDRAADHADLDFYLSPTSITLRGVCSDPIAGEIRISGIDAAKVVVRSAECTTPGFVIDRLTASADGEQQTLRFVGKPSEPGVWTGKLKLKMGSGVQSSLEVPLTVRTLAPWRAEPAGAVVRDAKPVTISLVQRGATPPTPSRVVMDPPLAGLSVTLTPAHELRVAFDGVRQPLHTTSSLVRVLSEAGEVCAVAPIVWYAR